MSRYENTLRTPQSSRKRKNKCLLLYKKVFCDQLVEEKDDQDAYYKINTASGCSIFADAFLCCERVKKEKK